MFAARSALAALATLALLGGAGCRAAVPSGAQCTFNEDCAQGLLCAGSTCRLVCSSNRDCTGGAVCGGSGQDGFRVCVAPEMVGALCSRAGDCAEGMTCTPDHQCRAQCRTDRDCQLYEPGATCTAAFACTPALHDGGAEAGVDAMEAGADAMEASTDAAEAGVDAMEAGADASEAGVDAMEAGVDAGPESALEASAEVGTDVATGRPDAGLDAVADSSPDVLSEAASDIATADLPDVALPDAGADASADAPSDTSTDAALDGAADSSADSGSDGASDGPLSEGSTLDGSSGDTGSSLAGCMSGSLTIMAEVTRVAVASKAVCAVIGSLPASLQCWGSNVNGEHGAGSSATATFDPVQYASPPGALVGDVASLSAGDSHFCAIPTAPGPVVCWGSNGLGQAGQGTVGGAVLAATPILGSATNRTLTLASNNGSCAQDPSSSGAPWACWGELYTMPGWSGMRSSVPGNVSPATMIAGGSLALGTAHGCLLQGPSDLVRCWINGLGGNSSGQLGNGSTSPLMGLVYVASSSAFTQLAVRNDSTCAVDTAGQVQCWGRNDTGQLGSDPSVNPRLLSPTVVAGLGSVLVRRVVMGEGFSCALTMDGNVWCWGSQASGALGDGAGSGVRYAPMQVSGIGNVLALEAGGATVCALQGLAASTPHTLQCWGANDSGQLGYAPPMLGANFCPVPQVVPFSTTDAHSSH